MSYIKDSNNFMHNIRDLKGIPNNALLVLADVVGFYHRIYHYPGLQPQGGIRAQKGKTDFDKFKLVES